MSGRRRDPLLRHCGHDHGQPAGRPGHHNRAKVVNETLKALLEKIQQQDEKFA